MREPIKNTGYQGLHLDWKQRQNKDENFFQCTAFILLDDVNENNGAIRVIPRSHKELVNIKSVSDNQDKRTKEDNNTLNMYDKKYSTLLTGKFGDIILIFTNLFSSIFLFKRSFSGVVSASTKLSTICVMFKPDPF